MRDECDKGSRSSVVVQNSDKKQEEKDSYEMNSNNKTQKKIRIR